MPLYTGIGGALKEIKALYTGVGGALKEMKTMYAGNEGALKQIYSSGTPLGDFEVGTEIQLYETTTGSDFGGSGYKPYILIEHDYPQSGVSLLMRKKLPTRGTSHGSNYNYTKNDNIDGYMLEHIAYLNEAAQSYLVDATWEVSYVSSSTIKTTTIQRKAIALTIAEIGAIAYFTNDTLKAVMESGSGRGYHTRTVGYDTKSGGYWYMITSNGSRTTQTETSTNYSYRPVFAFSSNAPVVDGVIGG